MKKHDAVTTAFAFICLVIPLADVTLSGGVEWTKWRVVGYGAAFALALFLVRPDAGRMILDHLPWGDDG